MVIGDGNSVFLDTNILVYASQTQSPFYQAAMEAIQGFYDVGVELWISRQVLREYLATLTRPQQFTNPLPIAIIIQDLRYFENRFRVAEDNSLVTERLLRLMEKFLVAVDKFMMQILLLRCWFMAFLSYSLIIQVILRNLVT